MHSERGRPAIRVAVVVAMVAALVAVIAPTAAFAADPDHVTVASAICVGGVSSSHYVANPSFDPNVPGSTPFICSDLKKDYSGNAGDGWNELDLVPFFAQYTAGQSAPSSQTYTVALALDAFDAGHPGFDFLTVPTLRASDSDSSCVLTSGPMLNLTPGFGGTDVTIYRKITITQNRRTTCTVDWDGRLAVGSHLYPGSSLHGNTADEALENTGEDRSVPVNAIQPQSINKDMSAQRDVTHTWNLTKGAEPASLDFGNTCDPNSPASQDVAITVTWTKGPATPSGDTSITANMYATNPAHRTITVNVTDRVYEGSTQTTLIHTGVLDTDPNTAGNQGFDVPANTSILVFTDTFLTSSTATSFNDVATATYTDKLTGIPVPGTTTATASATVTQGDELNASNTITDTESITGSGLTFSIADDPSVGAFTNYTAGDIVDSTGSVDWSYDATDGGSVTFDKTVYFAGPGSTSGTLSDTASSDLTEDATASVDITASTEATLTVNKDLTAPADGDTTFGFEVTGPNGFDQLVDVTVLDGETSGSNTLSGLEPGDYNVSEISTPSPWVADADQQFTVGTEGTAACVAEADFTDGFGPASATVQKVTDPVNNEAGWTFDLFIDDNAGPNGEDTLLSEVTTVDANPIDFGVDISVDGDYYILEHEQDGWTSDGGDAGCTFTASFPADADHVFACVFTNVKQGTIIVKKVTDPAGGTGFEFTGDAAGTIDDGQTIEVDNLDPGTYTSTESAKTGWDLTSISCDDGSSDTPSTTSGSTATFQLDPGETVTCTFTNTQRGHVKVIKTVSGQPPTGTQSFHFTLRSGASALSDGTILESGDANAANGGVINFTTNLVPGDHYQLCEDVMPGWNTTLPPPLFVPNSLTTPTLPNPNVNNMTVCTDFTVIAGETKTFNVDNSPPPGGRALTIGFWKNWASCASSKGGQKPVLDQTLAIAAQDAAGGLVVSAGNVGSGWPNFAAPYYLVLHAGDCQKAVNLLNKSTADGKKKMASDPLFNMTAQLIGAQLNYFAGAGVNGPTTSNITKAVLLDGKYHFDGNTYSPKLTTADAALANCLATQLDNYNNDRPVNSC